MLHGRCAWIEISLYLCKNLTVRAASIQLREAHCSFLRVDKDDFNRILKSVEANTVRLREHGHDVLVLQKLNEKYDKLIYVVQLVAMVALYILCTRYSVVLGTPDKVIDHMIEQKMNGDETEGHCMILVDTVVICIHT